MSPPWLLLVFGAMMKFRPISILADGKLIRVYMTEGQRLSGRMDPDRPGSVLTNYYGRDARASWRPDMPPAVAIALGIDASKPPTEEALDRLFEGKRADDAESWSKASRKYSAYDLCTSPEKTVTLSFEFAESDAEKAALLQAIWRANDRMMRFVACELGWARRGDGGAKGAEPGEVAWASFMHFTARPTLAVQDGPDGQTYVIDVPVPGDPQVHVHNALFNAVVTDSGHVGSLDTRQLAGRDKEYGAYFQAFLANELAALGIEIAYNKDEEAVIITCIPQHVRDAFSKGHASTVRKAKRYARDQGLDWEELGVERKLAILDNTAQHTRLSKFDGIPDRSIWRALAEKLGWRHESAVTGWRREELSDEERIERAARFTARKLEEEFRTAAVIDLNVVRMYAARGLIIPGIKSHRDIDAVVARVERCGIRFLDQDANLIVGPMGDRLRVTNSVQVAIERELGELVARASRDMRGALSREEYERGLALSGVQFRGEAGPAQRAASERLAMGGALVFLQGAAGVAKTNVAAPPAVHALKAAGYKVIGIAQAWRQADELKSPGADETVAVQPFLDGIASGEIKVDPKTALFIDEGVQLGPRQFLEIMRLWDRTGCLVRGMGDGEQCQAIEASSAYEIMTRNMPEEALPQLLTTVRQKTEREREIASLYRDGLAAQAVEMKRQDGTARLVGGDYDQVVERIAAFYVAKRDELRGSKMHRKGVSISALTNADSAAISAAVRGILVERGEIDRDGATYRAIDNRREQYDLTIACGDKLRLFKKTYAKVNGRPDFIGSNGDAVEVMGFWEGGLVLRNKHGDVGEVEWRRLKDPNTGRLYLGYGHCLTVDSAQGITSSIHINALPRGTAGITGFKAYVAESRHEWECHTLIGEWAERQAELASRPLGADTHVTREQLWNRVKKNMAEKPYKALGIDLVDQVSRGLDRAVSGYIHADQLLHKAKNAFPDLAEAVREELQERALRRVLSGKVEALAAVLAKQEAIVESFRKGLIESLAVLRVKLFAEISELKPKQRSRREAEPEAPRPPQRPRRHASPAPF